MRLLRFISCMSIFLLPGMTLAAGTCSIENSTPPLLTQYIKEVQEKISETSRMSGACGAPKDGSFSNINKFEEVIDRIDAQNPIIPDTITDFQYNITLAFNGESRDPVMRQGQVIRQLEFSIIEALKSASYKCILDVKMSGKYSEFTPELLLSRTLTTNKKIESYFKQVAIGNAGNTSDIDSKLADEIAGSYSKEGTAGCKSPDLMETLKNIGSKFMDKISQLGKSTAGSQNEWKNAIALFQGTNSNTSQYQELEKRLLRAELSKQGLSQNAANLMLSNLSCNQSKRSLNGTPEENGQADSDCRKDFIIGQNNIADLFKKPIFQATNTDAYAKKIRDYQEQKKILTGDMEGFWVKLQETKSDESVLNTKMMTDLVDIHIAISQTNEKLKKRKKEMIENCRKGQPEIPCPF